MISFPSGFLWGAATSAHQVEGDNRNNDWWEAEQRQAVPFASLAACRHYELFARDFTLARELGHTAHRFSLEWSRIEPNRGSFCAEALRHYRRVAESLRGAALEPIVTLHHFTNPVWFMREGGWERRDAVAAYLRYVGAAVEELGDTVRYWVTINEPMIYLYFSYLRGDWPPQKRSPVLAWRVLRNQLQAHCQAYRLIHQLYRRKGWPQPQVSFAHNVRVFEPGAPNQASRAACWVRDWLFNRFFLEGALRARTLDYIGINYYSRDLVAAKGWLPRNLFFDVCPPQQSRAPRNSLGWDIYPDGLLQLLEWLRGYRKDILILENGICTDDDAQRWEFIREHLRRIHAAIGRGVRVRGYLYWSLLDNFEWDKGFLPRFGLIAVDYRTFERTVRPSARELARVCAANALAD